MDLCPPNFLPSGVPKFPYNFIAAAAPFLPASLVCQKSDKIVKETFSSFKSQSASIFRKTKRGIDISPFLQSLNVLTETLFLLAIVTHLLYLASTVLNKISKLFFDNLTLMQQSYHTRSII